MFGNPCVPSIRTGSVSLLTLLTVCCAVPVFAATPDQWIAKFNSQWDETAWTQSRGNRPGYMRPLDDTGWETRMRAIQGLVAQGDNSVTPLLKMLHQGKPWQQAFAAHALSYLAPRTPREALLQTLTSNSEPTVRLYAADGLGRQGLTETARDLAALADKESNRDVKKHMAYAMLRKQQGIDPDVVRELIEWDSTRINSAQMGKPAPDFTLTALSGETVRLSQFRGKQPVVLVFIYGDT